jgi:hypothetical protein
LKTMFLLLLRFMEIFTIRRALRDDPLASHLHGERVHPSPPLHVHHSLDLCLMDFIHLANHSL